MGTDQKATRNVSGMVNEWLSVPQRGASDGFRPDQRFEQAIVIDGIRQPVFLFTHPHLNVPRPKRGHPRTGRFFRH